MDDAKMNFDEIHSIQMALVTGKVACEAMRQRAEFEKRSTDLYDRWMEEIKDAQKLMKQKSDEVIFGFALQ